MTERDLEAAIMEHLYYAPETGLFFRKKGRNKGKIAGSKTSYGYISIKVGNKAYCAHRLAWFFMYGKLPSLFIDHINGIKNDNVFTNLREVTKSQNSQNVKRIGVRKRKSTYDARIMTEGQSTYLGSFKTRAEACTAYLTAKQKLHVVASSHCFKD
jgi:hypothetical protein